MFVRHGESTTNKKKIFTGWMDVPLTDLGEQQASDAGKELKKLGYNFDVAYTSMLDRAVKTCDLVLDELDGNTYVHKAWRLNERHYGALRDSARYRLQRSTERIK